MKVHVALLLVAVSLSACSSKPREFTPILAAAPTDEGKYQADYQTCRVLVANGQRSGFGARMASGGLGVAAGVAGGAALAGGTGGTMVGAMAAASAAAVMAPVIGLVGAWGVAKHNKNRKERETKEAISLCLSESGYAVSAWERAKRQKSPR